MSAPILLLVDLQHHFLQRPGLQPAAATLLPQVAAWLRYFRQQGWPVCHLRTVVAADGHDAMAHWQQRPSIPCRAGSADAEAPPELMAWADEAVVHKRFYDPFLESQLAATLTRLAGETVRRPAAAETLPAAAETLPAAAEALPAAAEALPAAAEALPAAAEALPAAAEALPAAAETLPAAEAATTAWPPLIVAGLYTHACVRSVVIGCYERGWSPQLAIDACASPEPIHAEATRHFLTQRLCRLVTLADWRAADTALAADAALPRRPAAWFDGDWQMAQSDVESDWCHAQPATGVPCYRQPAATAAQIAAAVATLQGESTASTAAWPLPAAARRRLLQRWRDRLQIERPALLVRLREEIGKPPRLAAEEFDRAIAHLEGAIDLIDQLREPIADGVTVYHQPLGGVALITPWNNPLAIAIGKLAPALACGNRVVWKPAPECAGLSNHLLQTLLQVGLPATALRLLHGGAAVGEALLRAAPVAAASITGSIATGRQAAAICQQLGKGLQAELGGNNGAIIWQGADLPQVATDLIAAGFSFAGQRCTAIRRLIVQRDLLPTLQMLLAEALATFVAAPPEQTLWAPLISPQRYRSFAATVAAAVDAGATPLVGAVDAGATPLVGAVDAGATPLVGAAATAPTGCWAAPLILQVRDANAAIFQQESFGPLQVVMVADQFTEALTLLNCVPHGLIAMVCGGSAAERQQFAEQAQAGMLQFESAPRLHPQAPFAGWRDSAIGPPEHGRWDLQFYTRPQCHYQAPAGDFITR